MGGKQNKQQEAAEVNDGPMKLRSAKYKNGKTKQTGFDVLDGDDDEYFRLLESGQLDEKTKRKREENLVEIGHKHQLQAKGTFDTPPARNFTNGIFSFQSRRSIT